MCLSLLKFRISSTRGMSLLPPRLTMYEFQRQPNALLEADAGEFDIRPSKIQFFKTVLLPAHASYDVEKHYAASAKTRTNARIHNPSATLTKSKKKQTARDAADHSRKNHSLHSGGQTPRPHLRQGQWQQQQPQKRHDPSAASSQKSAPVLPPVPKSF